VTERSDNSQAPRGASPRRAQRETVIDIPDWAPGFANALLGLGLDAQVAGGRATIRPGPAPPLLKGHRLASRGQNVGRIWEVLAEHPRADETTVHHGRALQEVDRLAGLGTTEGLLSAISLLVLITNNASTRPMLEPQLDGLWAAMPDMTLWLINAEPALLSRQRLTQILVQIQATPELRLSQPGDDGRRSLAAQSLTGGVVVADVIQPVFLIFSPAATGFATSWLPHCLALEFGAMLPLRENWPGSINQLFDARVLTPPPTEMPRDFWINSVPKHHLGSILAWWVDRMDKLYAITTDPTRFVDDDGKHLATEQLAFSLTTERVLADLRVLGAWPQTSALIRLGAAFDLIDKLETLLGYGPTSKRKFGNEWASGRGFANLLNPDFCLPILHRGFQQMPLQVSPLFIGRAKELFAKVQEGIRDGVVANRLQGDRVFIGPDRDTDVPFTEYIGRLVRSVRNSSHGLMDQLAGGPNAQVALSHTGAIPEELADLASLIAIALLAEPERLWSMDLNS
jgi:hypothetical protein